RRHNHRPSFRMYLSRARCAFRLESGGRFGRSLKRRWTCAPKCEARIHGKTLRAHNASSLKVGGEKQLAHHDSASSHRSSVTRSSCSSDRMVIFVCPGAAESVGSLNNVFCNTARRIRALCAALGPADAKDGG